MISHADRRHDRRGPTLPLVGNRSRPGRPPAVDPGGSRSRMSVDRLGRRESSAPGGKGFRSDPDDRSPVGLVAPTRRPPQDRAPRQRRRSNRARRPAPASRSRNAACSRAGALIARRRLPADSTANLEQEAANPTAAGCDGSATCPRTTGAGRRSYRAPAFRLGGSDAAGWPRLRRRGCTAWSTSELPSLPMQAGHPSARPDGRYAMSIARKSM
jgi:hypothetical protein